VRAFDLESVQRPGERDFPSVSATASGREAAAAANQRGAEAFERGDLAAAARAFEEAVRALGPGDTEAGDYYENLGIAYHQLGRDSAAARAFLRALDGRLAAREQSLRLLVVSCGRAGRRADARRYLVEYEAAFGPHPSGITSRQT